MKERWKLISRYVKGIRGYAISDHGKVMRLVRGPHTHPGLILKPTIYKGYVSYYFCQNKILKRAHYLVLEAFVGPRPKGKEGNHKDGIKINNYYKNLEWMTSKENTEHAIKNGLWNPTVPRKRILTNKQKKRISKSDLPSKILAKRYGITHIYVNTLKRNKEFYNKV